MRRLLVVGCINRYPEPDGWEHVHLDASGRPLYDLRNGGLAEPDLVADMRRLPLPEESFDRIQSWHSLEHVNARGGEQAVQEFFRVLRPGGILDVQVPDLSRIGGVPEEDVEALLPYLYGQQPALGQADDDLQVHRWGYTRRSLTALLDGVGFESIRDGFRGDLHLLAEKPRD